MRRTPFLLLLVACGGPDGSSPGPESEPPSVETADALFDESEFNDVRLDMAPEDWDSILQDSRGDEYRLASFAWKDRRLDRVGVRPSGESTRYAGNPKMSLRLTFDAFVPSQKFLGLGSLKLDGLSSDWSMMRDRISYGIYRERMPAPRAVHCRLFVNGEHRGVYEIEERVGEAFVESRFGAKGNLYRIWIATPEPYAWRGDDPALYVPFPWEPKTHEKNQDSSFVLRYLDTLNHRPSEFGSICDLDRLIEFLAIEAAVTQMNGMAGDFGPHNHYQYFRPETGRFVAIPWDLGATWWDDAPDRSIFQNFQNSRLTALVENDPALRTQYVRKIGEVIESLTDPARIAQRVDLIYRQISAAAHEDPYKPYGNRDFDDSPAFIKEFAVQRRANLRAQVSAYGGGMP